MQYELHMTTAPDVDVDHWSALCAWLRTKPLLIRLATGESPRQVMMTGRHDGDDQSAATWRGNLHAAFGAAGFPIIREKMEIPLDKSGDYPAAYYEAHIKMLLAEPEARALPDLADAVGLHLSTNELARTVDGREKWYLTARAYGVDLDDAAAGFGEKLAHVTSLGWHGVRMEMEAVLADSNPALDAGWAAP